jgi:hypothetical protein
MTNNGSYNELLAMLQEKYPFLPYTRASRLFSLVRRMKAEKEYDIPISLRSGFAVSVELNKHAHEMTEQEWENFYNQFCEQLKRDYPRLYNRLFPRINFMKFNISKN